MGTNNSRFFFVLLSVGAAIGLGNIWLYPYLSFKSTGLFFVPYFIALIVLGAPLFILEFSISQYFNKNIVDCFSSIRKWFSSIGWLMAINSFIVMGIYAVIFSWHLIYVFVSFGLQWKHDAKSYFFKNVLQASNSFGNFTQFSLPVFIALIITWVIIFFFIKKGLESMKKAFLITLPALVFFLIFFLFYSLTLNNALNGIHSFLKPNFRSFLDLNVWLNSFYLATLSLGLSFGVISAFARKCEKGFVAGNSFIIVTFKLLISIAIGFIVFGILGFLSMKQGLALDRLAFSDFNSPFVILAQALPFFYKPTLLSILFFIFLSLFFVLGTSSLAYSILTILVDKLKTKQKYAAIIVTGFGFLFGLLFIINPGFHIMTIVIHFIYYNILLALLLESLAIGWFFDSHRIVLFINQNSILKIGAVWRFVIRYTIPLILLVLIFLQLKSDVLVGHKAYPWHYTLIFGIGVVIVPLIISFLMPKRLLDRR